MKVKFYQAAGIESSWISAEGEKKLGQKYSKWSRKTFIINSKNEL